MAQICEKAERFDEMLEFMKRVSLMEQEMSEEERELFAVAYKEAIGARRRSWRVVCNIEKVEDEKDNRFINLIRDYKDRIEKELMKYGDELIGILEGKLIPVSAGVNPTAQCSYLKLKADFHRYAAEVSVGDTYTRSCEKAKQAYEEAEKLIKESHSPAHPLKLSIELNRLVMQYEILNIDEPTITEAKKIFEGAQFELDTLKEEEAKESRILLKLLKDNIELWSRGPQVFTEAEKHKKDQMTDSKMPGLPK